MNRVIRSIVCLCVFLILITPILAFANSIPEERLLPRLVDNANLLSDDEYQVLLEKLDEISEREQFDIAIVTIDSLGGYTSTEYAHDFYDYNGYGMGSGYDGILLLISMEDRDWAISTNGLGNTAFTDADQEYLVDQFIGDLGNGNYATAFNKFADVSENFIVQEKEDNTNNPYNSYNPPNSPSTPYLPNNSYPDLPKTPSPYLPIITTIIGAVIAFIITGIMRGQLKSVHMQAAASNYIKSNGFKINESKDLFLYANVSRTKIEKQQSSSSGSSTHTSSSGRSHGGSSGKF